MYRRDSTKIETPGNEASVVYRTYDRPGQQTDSVYFEDTNYETIAEPSSVYTELQPQQPQHPPRPSDSGAGDYYLNLRASGSSQPPTGSRRY